MAKLVSRLLWEQEAARSNRATRTMGISQVVKARDFDSRISRIRISHPQPKESENKRCTVQFTLRKKLIVMRFAKSF